MRPTNTESEKAQVTHTQKKRKIQNLQLLLFKNLLQYIVAMATHYTTH